MNKKLDALAVHITNIVGSMGFFLLIFAWTVAWTGYNIAATEAPRLHWKSFDPFPAFVAYLLISNVIQILLMPLIMVGQNVQARQSDTRAELDFKTNQAAEQEIAALGRETNYTNRLLLQMMAHLEIDVDAEERRAIDAEAKLGEEISQALNHGAKSA